MQRKCQRTELGDLIRAGRQKLDLTLEMCGMRLGGISRQAVKQMEVGQNRFGNDQALEYLVDFLKLDIDFLRAIRPKRKLCKKKRDTPLGNFLTKRRLRANLTQDKVVKWAGIARFLSNIER